MVRATFIFRYKKLRVRLTSASGFELISRTLCCYWPLARRITAWSNSKPADWRFVCPQCLLLLIGFLFGAPWSLVVNQPHVLQSDATVRLTSLSSCPPFSVSFSLFLFDSLSFYNRAKKLGLLWYIEKGMKKREGETHRAKTLHRDRHKKCERWNTIFMHTSNDDVLPVGFITSIKTVILTSHRCPVLFEPLKLRK